MEIGALLFIDGGRSGFQFRNSSGGNGGRDLQLFGTREDHAGRLLAVAQGSVDQVDAGGNPDWKVDPLRAAENGVGSWGWHAIAEHAARISQGTTWGLNAHWTDPWQSKYCSVLHMALLRDWRLSTGRAPNGFEYQQLLSDAHARGAIVATP